MRIVRRLDLSPNDEGAVIDRQCPECGAWASEHTVIAKGTVIPGIHTMEEMRAIPDNILTTDFLKCPR